MRPRRRIAVGRSVFIAPLTRPARRRTARRPRPVRSGGSAVPAAVVGCGHPCGHQRCVVFFIRERPHPGLHVRHPWVVQGLPRRYWRVLTIVGLFSVVNFPDTLLLLRADELGYGFAGVVALYVLYNLTYAGLSYPAGLVSDRLNRRVVYATGLVVFAATYLGFGVAGDASCGCGYCSRSTGATPRSPTVWAAPGSPISSPPPTVAPRWDPRRGHRRRSPHCRDLGRARMAGHRPRPLHHVRHRRPRHRPRPIPQPGTDCHPDPREHGRAALNLHAPEVTLWPTAGLGARNNAQNSAPNVHESAPEGAQNGTSACSRGSRSPSRWARLSDLIDFSQCSALWWVRGLGCR